MLMPPLKESSLQREIELFFDRDDVSRVCPDKKKVVKNPNNSVAETVPLRYRLSSLKVLHQKFALLLWDTRTKPDDWGRCLCAVCLNPKLKLETLA